jgi:GNAT superfamily N-acetyltransferase
MQEPSFVTCVLRPPTLEELPTLSALCLRSKAVWGYGNDFMDACRGELTIEAYELQSSSIVVAEENGKIVGVAQVQVTGSEADLLKLFVDPTMLRNGVGMRLFHWATSAATAMGAHRMVIEADPDAAPFYRRMGAEDCGFAPSGSLPGRMLPKLVTELRSI